MTKEDNQKRDHTAAINVVVADDEEHVRKLLIQMLRAFPDIVVVGEAATGDEVISLSKAVNPHVVFLDINMPPPSGIDAAREILDDPTPPMIVFVTAYNEYALDAFELHASDYLIKPVEEDRLQKTIERIRNLLQKEELRQKQSTDMMKWLHPEGKPIDRIAVLDKEKDVRKIVKLNEVLWFTSKGEKCFAHLAHGSYEVSYNMVLLTKRLPGDIFIRTHKSFIINIDHIKEIAPSFHGAHTLTMTNNEEVPLSRNYVGDFRQKVPWL